jgi:hypothetical protein
MPASWFVCTVQMRAHVSQVWRLPRRIGVRPVDVESTEVLGHERVWRPTISLDQDASVRHHAQEGLPGDCCRKPPFCVKGCK